MMMKLGLAGVALALSGLVAPALAQGAPATMGEYVSGNIAVWGTYGIPRRYLGEDYGDICANSDAFFDWNQDFCRSTAGAGGDFRIHSAQLGQFGFQFEVLTQYQRSMSLLGDGEEFEDVPDTDLHGFQTAVVVHGLSRGSSVPFGLFVGVTHTTSMAAPQRATHFVGGLEIAGVGAATTVYGQLGGAVAIEPEDALGTLIFGRVGARHFFGANTLLEVAVAGGFAPEADIGDEDIDQLAWVQFASTFEHAFGGGPLSFFSTYQADYVRSILPDECCDTTLLVHSLKAGIRLSFGGTLAEQNATGARTFTMPNIFWPITVAPEMN